MGSETPWTLQGEMRQLIFEFHGFAVLKKYLRSCSLAFLGDRCVLKCPVWQVQSWTLTRGLSWSLGFVVTSAGQL